MMRARIALLQCSLDLQMRYVAAYLLATLGGNASPSAADVKAILSSVGIEADAAKLDKVWLRLRVYSACIGRHDNACALFIVIYQTFMLKWQI